MMATTFLSTSAARRWWALAAFLSVFAISAQAQVPVPVQGQPPAPLAECPPRLRVAFTDTTAGQFVHGQGQDFASPPGLLVDWLQAALRQIGCPERAEFVRLPVRRVQAMIKSRQLDLVAGVIEGGPVAALLSLPPREGRKHEFDFSIGTVEYALYALRSSNARWDGHTLMLGPAEARLGVLAGSRTEMLARERSWSLEAAPSDESAWRKLISGRTPVLLINTIFADERLRGDAELARQIVKLEPIVEQRRLFFGAVPEFAQEKSHFMRLLWRELCRQSNAAGSDGACRLAPG